MIGRRGLEGWRGHGGDGIGVVLRKAGINGGRRCVRWAKRGKAGSGVECGGGGENVVGGANVVSIYLSLYVVRLRTSANCGF